MTSKRKLLIATGAAVPMFWFKPVVESVVLPAHGRISMDDSDDDKSEDNGSEDNGSEDQACRDGKVEICHHPAQQGTEPFEICVAEPAVDAHIRNHGDFVGPCK